MAYSSKVSIGKSAELIACQYLQRQGLGLVASNYHCRWGEIDLIMQDQTEIVFVEVKCRRGSEYGLAIETITPSKQRKLIQSAYHFLQCHRELHKHASRFDVVAIQNGNVEWIKDAFMECENESNY